MKKALGLDGLIEMRKYVATELALTAQKMAVKLNI